MTKTPEQMAEEYASWVDAGSHAYRGGVYEGFLVGYHAAMDQLAEASKVINSPEKPDGSNQTNLLTPAKWISVKDRLPEINQGFIAFVQNKEVCNCHRYQNRSTDDTPIFYASTKTGLLICGLESVSHWQPLPAPPKEEK